MPVGGWLLSNIYSRKVSPYPPSCFSCLNGSVSLSIPWKPVLMKWKERLFKKTNRVSSDSSWSPVGQRSASIPASCWGGSSYSESESTSWATLNVQQAWDAFPSQHLCMLISKRSRSDLTDPKWRFVASQLYSVHHVSVPCFGTKGLMLATQTSAVNWVPPLWPRHLASWHVVLLPNFLLIYF